MPKHEIIAHLPLHAMKNEDFTIEVRSNGQLLGDLIVGQGSVRWRPGGRQYGYRLGWERFDQVMQENGTPN
jgi:hypothetical protein